MPFSVRIDSLTLLAEEAARQAEQPPLVVLMIPAAIIGVLYYLLIWRPQQRQNARREEVRTGMKKNDRVVSIGGIVGTISHLSQDGRFVTLKMEDGSKIRLLRSAIQGPLEEASVDSSTPPDADSEREDD